MMHEMVKTTATSNWLAQSISTIWIADLLRSFIFITATYWEAKNLAVQIDLVIPIWETFQTHITSNITQFTSCRLPDVGEAPFTMRLQIRKHL